MSSRLKSVLWMVLWAACFSAAMTVVKFVEGVSTPMIVFLRFLISLLIFFPLLKKEKQNPLKTDHFPFHVLNAVFRIVALFSTYYAYTNLPMGLAASIGYTGPIISILLAMMLLNEKVGAQKWIAVTVGYTGVLFMFEPSNFSLTIALLIALLANLMSSLAKITTKRLTKTDTPGQILFLCNGIAAAIVMIYIFGTGEIPPQNTWAMLVIVGVFGSFSQFSYIKALQNSDVSSIAPFEYLRLIMAVPIGYFVFNEYLSVNDMIGGFLIVICSGYLVYREHQKSKSALNTQ